MKSDIDKLLRKHGGLKARQIAKQLGCDRAAVNSFLYAHPEEYGKDENHVWTTIGAAEVAVELPAGWTTAASFEQALIEAQFGRIPASLVLSFAEDCKLMFDCIARILAVANHVAGRGSEVVLD